MDSLRRCVYVAGTTNPETIRIISLSSNSAPHYRFNSCTAIFLRPSPAYGMVFPWRHRVKSNKIISRNKMTQPRSVTNPPIQGHKNLSPNGNWMKAPAKPHNTKTLFSVSGGPVIPEKFYKEFTDLIRESLRNYKRVTG
jgi:hypothetical protein